MIVELLAQLPETIEVYGYRFKRKIYYESFVSSWVIAYVPDAILKKTAAKKKMFANGRWIDQCARISTNGGIWLVAKPIENHRDNASFERALTQMMQELASMQYQYDITLFEEGQIILRKPYSSIGRADSE